MHPEHEDVQLMHKRISTLLDKPLEDIEAIIETATEEASEVTQAFGLPRLTIVNQNKKDIQFLEPNKKLQTSIFKEIADMQKKGTDMNLLFKMVAEGIHRGIGMDRTMFSTLMPDHTLKSRIILSQDPESNDKQLTIPLTGQAKNYFHHALEKKQPIYFSENPSLDVAVFRTIAIKELFDESAIFMMPIIIQNKPIGLFIADRCYSKRSLSENDFTAFKNFVDQANNYLSKLKKRRQS